MMILDTNVLSELMRSSPDTNVARWVDQQPLEDLGSTAVTVAEILFGLDLMADGRRKTDLSGRFALMLQRGFSGEVLPFDEVAAIAYALIKGDRSRSGRPISSNDAMIAAIARTRGAAVVTRNVADFERCGIALINPWSAQDTH